MTFELSKVKTPAIRERMVSHLLNIDETLANKVADKLGLQKMPKPACQSASKIDTPYFLICECYPDGANADDDPMSIDRPRQVAFPACSTRGAVGGSGPA